MTIESTLSRTTYIKLSLRLLLRNYGFFITWGITSIPSLIGLLYGKKFILLYVTLILIFPILICTACIVLPTFFKRTRSYFAHKEYTFSDEGLFQNSVLWQGLTKWTAFTKWQRLADCYLLYIQTGQMFIIPISAIPPQDITNFETMLNEKN